MKAPTYFEFSKLYGRARFALYHDEYNKSVCDFYNISGGNFHDKILSFFWIHLMRAAFLRKDVNTEICWYSEYMIVQKGIHGSQWLRLLSLHLAYNVESWLKY